MGMIALLLALAAPPTLQQQMQVVEARRNAAIWAGDAATLERLYAADFQGIAATGLRVDRAALLAMLRRNAGGDFIADSRILSVREVNGLVIVEGQLKLWSTGGRALLSDTLYVHIFRRSADDGWELVEAAATPIPARPRQ